MMTSPDPAPLLRSAAVLAHTLLAIFLALLLAIPVLILWLTGDLSTVGATLATQMGFPQAVLRTWQVDTLGCIATIHILIWACVVWQGREIFMSLRDNDPAGASAAARRTAVALWAMLGWSILSHPLGTLVTTWHLPEGERAIAVTLGAAHIQTLLAALLAMFLSRAFVLGADLWQDHREVI